MTATDSAATLREAADALATALALEDARLVKVLVRTLRQSFGAEAGDPATPSLLLRQLERAARAGDFAAARPILAEFRASLG